MAQTLIGRPGRPPGKSQGESDGKLLIVATALADDPMSCSPGNGSPCLVVKFVGAGSGRDSESQQGSIAVILQPGEELIEHLVRHPSRDAVGRF